MTDEEWELTRDAMKTALGMITAQVRGGGTSAAFTVLNLEEDQTVERLALILTGHLYVEQVLVGLLASATSRSRDEVLESLGRTIAGLRQEDS